MLLLRKRAPARLQRGDYEWCRQANYPAAPLVDVMRIIHVIASIADESSGPSYSVPRLCAALANVNDDVRLMSVGASLDQYREGFRHTVFSQDGSAIPLVGRLRRSRELAVGLAEAAKRVDVLHGHGLWLMPNIYTASVARRTGRPLIVSTRGMLHSQALAISRIKKLVFWYALQKRALESVACFHATSIDEYAALRNFGLRQPVAVIPNGMDLKPANVKNSNLAGRQTLLYLGRIHPIKNLESLIEAWLKLEGRFPNWDLRIVGSGDEKYIETLKKRVRRHDGAHRIEFTGPVYGAAKAAAYEAADLYVLPSKSENFAVTVAEALAAGKPVITTIGTPWRVVNAEKCGWWINHGAEALGAALATALEMPLPKLAAMGARGRNLIAQEFTWKSIAVGMHKVYEWLAGRGERPSSIEIE